MAGDKDPKKEKPTIFVPKQMTFTSKTTLQLDSDVNAWLEKLALAKEQMPLKGDSFAFQTNEGMTYGCCYQYLEKKEVPES